MLPTASSPDTADAAEALELAGQIFAARANLKSLEERFARLIARGSSNAAPTPTALARAAHEDEADEDNETEEDAAGSGASQVLAAFQRHPDKNIPVQMIVDELSHLDSKLVRSNAARFARKGKLKHVKRGVYKYVSPVDTKNEE